MFRGENPSLELALGTGEDEHVCEAFLKGQGLDDSPTGPLYCFCGHGRSYSLDPTPTRNRRSQIKKLADCLCVITEGQWAEQQAWAAQLLYSQSHKYCPVPWRRQGGSSSVAAQTVTRRSPGHILSILGSPRETKHHPSHSFIQTL